MTQVADALRRRLDELAALNAVGEILNREGSFTSAAAATLERLVELLSLEAGWVFISAVPADGRDAPLTVAAHTGLPTALARDAASALRHGGCDCHTLYRRGRLDAGVNIVSCSRLQAAVGDTAGLEIHASVPLLGARGPVGIMNLAAPGRTRFDEATLAFLTAVGRQLGIAFERSALQEARTREVRYTAALEERQRLATLMHDSVAQTLFAAELALHTALLDSRSGDERVEAAAGLVAEALERLRALVEVLRPVDDGTPLEVLLARLADRLSGTLDVRLELEPAPLEATGATTAESTGRSPAAVTGVAAQALYRIAQEASHNVIKHARARTLWVRLERSARARTLRIADDGVGIAPSADGGAGLGMHIMREAATEAGGVLRVRDRDGGGTVVEVETPWPGS